MFFTEIPACDVQLSERNSQFVYVFRFEELLLRRATPCCRWSTD